MKIELITVCYIMTSLLGYFGGKRGSIVKKSFEDSRLHIVFIMVIFIIISREFHTLQCFSNCLKKNTSVSQFLLFCVIKKSFFVEKLLNQLGKCL